ncbi:MAG: cation-efflux pump [Desulfovibrio sp.]|jgi:cation diffusion facilitator family transporter|nr:cation-efflux pump [Desulfovibrio sp.]
MTTPPDSAEAAGRGNDSAEKNRAALVSLLAALGLTCLKLGVGLYTGSLGILFEALHSGLDLLAAGMTLAAVRIAAMPPDAGHPYGHGKIENLSALAETLLLAAGCVWVGYEGALRLAGNGNTSMPSLLGVGVMAVSIAVDINRVRVLRRVARQYKSQALEADALHFSTDILSSGIVLVGVFAVWLADALDFPPPLHKVLVQADTVAALLVALVILRASLRMGLEAVNTLMDSSSVKEEKAVGKAVGSVPGITAMRRLRLRSSGPLTFVELTVGVEPDIHVSEGHRLAHEAEKAVAAVLPGSDVTVHVEPFSADFPPGDDPFVLTSRTAREHALTAHNIHVLRNGARTRIELHVELPAALPFAAAYERVHTFEGALGQRLPDAHILTHLEPEGGGELDAETAIPTPLREQAFEKAKEAAADEPLIEDVHEFSVYMLPEHGICMSFHCTVTGNPTVEEAHNVCLRLEKRIRAALPDMGRIITRLEPGRNRLAGNTSPLQPPC